MPEPETLPDPETIVPNYLMSVRLAASPFMLLLAIANAALELHDMETADFPLSTIAFAQRIQNRRLDQYRELRRTWTPPA